MVVVKLPRPLAIAIIVVAVVFCTIAKFDSPPEPSTTSSYKTNVAQSSFLSADEVAPIIIASKNKTKATIWHYPSQCKICVRLDYNWCPHPDLLGRISGSSLAVLDDWRKIQSRNIIHHENGTIWDTAYCGSYKNAWLPPGKYNLEIIVVVCSSFGLTSPMRIINFTKWLDYDFKNDCLEDPQNSQITLSSSSLTVESEISRVPEDNREKLLKGHWNMDKRRDTHFKEPMSTRYQPQNCRGQQAKLERCTSPMNNSHF